MNFKNMALALALVLPTACLGFVARDAPISEYFRFHEEAFGGPSAVGLTSTLIFEEQARLVRIDGTGLQLSDCDNGFSCFSYGDFEIALPAECELESRPEWRHQGSDFRVLRNLDPYVFGDSASIRSARFLIEVGRASRIAGYFTYSVNLGVHSFMFRSKLGSREEFAQYHLTSRSGMLSGACDHSQSGEESGAVEEAPESESGDERVETKEGVTN